MKKKLIIKSEIEIEELEIFIKGKIKILKKGVSIVMHVLEFSFKGLLYILIGDRIFDISQRTRPKKKVVSTEYTSTSNKVHDTKNGENTAKTIHFEPVEVVENCENNQREGEGETWVESSTIRKCKNPECKKTFERMVRGNQEKKFCSSACKDKVNNAKKMNNYHYEK